MHRTKRRAEGARPRDLDRRIAPDRGYTPAARAAPQHQQRPIGPKRRPEQTGNGSDPCLPEPFSAGLSGGKICNAVTCQLLSPFLRSRRPGQLNYCGRIRPTTLIVGTETGHFPADEPNSVVWSSCSSVCGSFSVGARRRDGACSGSLACSRRPFLCAWKPRPVRLCLGLLAPLSAPLPSAVFFLASLRRALGIPPSTALAERQSPASLALVIERSSPASAVASFGHPATTIRSACCALPDTVSRFKSKIDLRLSSSRSSRQEVGLFSLSPRISTNRRMREESDYLTVSAAIGRETSAADPRESAR